MKKYYALYILLCSLESRPYPHQTTIRMSALAETLRKSIQRASKLSSHYPKNPPRQCLIQSRSHLLSFVEQGLRQLRNISLGQILLSHVYHMVYITHINIWGIIRQDSRKRVINHDIDENNNAFFNYHSYTMYNCICDRHSKIRWKLSSQTIFSPLERPIENSLIQWFRPSKR